MPGWLLWTLMTLVVGYIAFLCGQRRRERQQRQRDRQLEAKITADGRDPTDWWAEEDPIDAD